MSDGSMSWRNLSGSGLKRAKKETLVEAYLELTGQDTSKGYSYPGTKTLLISAIEKLREKEREQMFRNRNVKKVCADLCEISAREVNDWLRTIPRAEPV